VRKALLQTVD
jgi:hypothetical protein